MLEKTTKVYANHGMTLECDIFAASDYPKDTPVFLYFHPGGLVAFGRDSLPPWLVQTCYERKWPLISPSYRLLPQTGGKGLVEDAKAAYAFARKWDVAEGQSRPVIAGGGSGGFFNAPLLATCDPPPLALFSISGINTFRHKFFNSSTQLTPEPIPDSDMADIIAGPITIGRSGGGAKVFHPDKLLASGAKNPDYKSPPPFEDKSDGYDPERCMLYDYYTYKNAWLEMVGDVDPGYEWAKNPNEKDRVAAWPETVIFHGDTDFDVPLSASEEMRDALGEEKVHLFVAKGQDHLFENAFFLEDDEPGMEAVKAAIKCLDEVVARRT